MGLESGQPTVCIQLVACNELYNWYVEVYGGLCILLQPLVLQGWNTEKACVDWNLVWCVGMGGGEGVECDSRVTYTIQAQAMYSLYAEIAHHNRPLLSVATMCSDES